MSSTAPFSIITAFADNPNAGNPAAIVFVDVNKYSDEIYGKVAQNFNQPMSAFVSPSPRPESTEKDLHYDIRYFAPNAKSVPLCGHATLAAAKAVLNTKYATEAVEAVEFHTKSSGTVTVRKRPGGFLELSLTPNTMTFPDRGQYALMTGILKKTFGREVIVNHIGFGTGEWKDSMLVELDEKENLKELQFDTSALKQTGRIIHIFTTRCSTGPELFHSRMFAPGYVPGDEDPVCATAHCLLTPYWSTKLEIPRGKEIEAKQVSARGGSLKLVWDADADKLHLKGTMVELAHGEVFVSS